LSFTCPQCQRIKSHANDVSGMLKAYAQAQFSFNAR